MTSKTFHMKQQKIKSEFEKRGTDLKFHLDAISRVCISESVNRWENRFYSSTIKRLPNEENLLKINLLNVKCCSVSNFNIAKSVG